MRQVLIFSIWALILTLLISYFGEVSLAFSFACVTVFASVGHLISLDDDFKGGWGNPEGDRSIVLKSILELVAKIAFSVLTWWVVLSFPSVNQYGI
ncbi:hypothetical protein [Aliiglaciecola litoralis]|uniref:Uncharacterized protein n=1 Tax=Aliiglaciecola litoralis TaxID=582857 RepID=A0ABP3X4C4_9ALTE